MHWFYNDVCFKKKIKIFLCLKTHFIIEKMLRNLISRIVSRKKFDLLGEIVIFNDFR